jgi:hypothetical protein
VGVRTPVGRERESNPRPKSLPLSYLAVLEANATSKPMIRR